MHWSFSTTDESIAQFMATVASARGWDAHAVTHEAEFQALIRAVPPDAIILDLQLGASDGIEQLRFLHSVGYHGAIVLMSGFDARVLASAEQIGNSLGLSIVAVDREAGARGAGPATCWRRSSRIRAAAVSPAARRTAGGPIGLAERRCRRRSMAGGWSCICNRSCPPPDMR